MPRQPLYPHQTKKREPLFPHVPRTQSQRESTIVTYYHESPQATKILKEGFDIDIERRRDPGDFGWGIYLWKSPRKLTQPRYTLKVDVDITNFAVIHDSYQPEVQHYDTPYEILFRRLAFGEDRFGNEAMSTLHGRWHQGEEAMSREDVCKQIRSEFLKRGIQGLITLHDRQSIEEVVIFDTSAIVGVQPAYGIRS